MKNKFSIFFVITTIAVLFLFWIGDAAAEVTRFTPTPTLTNTPEPTITNTPEPTITNTPEPTVTLTNTPEPTATPTSIKNITPTPFGGTATPIKNPTKSPPLTLTPTLTPNPTKTFTPTPFSGTAIPTRFVLPDELPNTGVGDVMELRYLLISAVILGGIVVVVKAIRREVHNAS